MILNEGEGIVLGAAIAGVFGLIGIIANVISIHLANKIEYGNKIKYMKNEYSFKQKIAIYEEIGKLTWQNHLAITTILNALDQKKLDDINKEIIKRQIQQNITSFAEILKKVIYFSDELRVALGKYITLYEEYLNDKNFGEIKRTEKLKIEKSKYVKEINEIIKIDLKKIK